MTVGSLIYNLIAFADYYEQSSAAIACDDGTLRRLQIGQRDANADSMQRDFRATVAIDRVRAYVLGNYGADLTIGTSRRLLGDLVRRYGLTVSAAEEMTLEAAMDRLEANAAPAAGQDEATPLLSPVAKASLSLMRVFTDGVSDERFKNAAELLADSRLTTNEKLIKIDKLLRFPAKVSAEQLGEMLGVTKQAVLKTDWWVQNRKGEKEDEIGRRREAHRKRARSYEVRAEGDTDE
jgi:hypothetical protein